MLRKDDSVTKILTRARGRKDGIDWFEFFDYQRRKNMKSDDNEYFVLYFSFSLCGVTSMYVGKRS